MTDIQKEFFARKDESYRDFNSSLIPGVDKEKIIGVRVPTIRALAKRLNKEGGAHNFMQQLPHEYFEENMLHGILLNYILDFDEYIAQTERFLPYVDNWAVCDSMCVISDSNKTNELKSKAFEWIKSDHAFTIRFGILVLMKRFLGDEYEKEIAEKIADLRSDQYYVKMIQAWYLATAANKHFEDVENILKSKRPDAWVQNKAIQKAKESLVIPKEAKEKLKGLKI